jgi:hypothetical protein
MKFWNNYFLMQPVIFETYDEIVFMNPNDFFFNLLMQYQQNKVFYFLLLILYSK